ncbi:MULTISPECIES: hypothetical protein [Sorangium]|uniref:Uncharacterized protein n=1 Tax=Sorangium cellulosum TaxID=56 RepID=A0A4V0NGF2_SORCE|nr:MULTISPECIES: hypothetical protein [Sorangium]AUX32962.1 uncharacterized protein SOCE836_051140 [Sorangium cellulosum]WCQ92338.1 hypothetical protein NQZ70_05079 [Sorangium sp. Soce836]
MNASSPARARPARPLAVAVAVAVAAALALTGARAHAQPHKRACAAAYERAQGLRRDGKLLAAREALIACSQPTCPAAAVADCGPWLAEVEKSLPTVVIAARDAHGRERLDVRVLVDGRPLAAALDGKALPVDPGPHTFRYEPASGPAVEERVLIREGEKNRAITVILGASSAGAPPATPTPASPAASPASPASPAASPASPALPAASPASPALPAASPAPPAAPSAPPSAPPEEPAVPGLVWASGALGAAGLAVFAVAGALSLSAEADLRATCAPRCPGDDVRAIRVQHAIADVGLGVGVVALGAAAWLYLTRPAAARPPNAGAAAPGPALRPFVAGAAAGIEGAF